MNPHTTAAQITRAYEMSDAWDRAAAALQRALTDVSELETFDREIRRFYAIHREAAAEPNKRAATL